MRGYTKSEPGAVATGSKRMHNRFVLPIRSHFVMTGVVQYLGTIRSLPLPGSDFVWPPIRYLPSLHASSSAAWYFSLNPLE
jgi:hypothetical protein